MPTLTTFTAGAGVLALGAVALLVWALLIDRRRRLARCPRCWYDLGPAPGESSGGGREPGTARPQPSLPLTCPECGERITKPRQLHRTRRRWRVALLAIPMLLVAYELPRVPAIRARGYAAALPTTALVLGADLGPLGLFDPESLAIEGPLLAELNERLPLSRLDGALMNARVRYHARRAGLHEILRDPRVSRDGRAGSAPETGPVAVRVYDLSDAMDVAEWPFDIEPPRLKGGVIFDGGPHEPGFDGEAEFYWVLEVIQKFVAFESWRDNGGDLGMVFRFDERSLIARTSHAAHLEIERLLDAIEHPESIVGGGALPHAATPPGGARSRIQQVRVYDIAPAIAVGVPAGKRYRSILSDLMEGIIASVDPPGWRVNGGDQSLMRHVGTRLVIRTTPENHEAILAHLRRALDR